MKKLTPYHVDKDIADESSPGNPKIDLAYIV